MPPTVPVAPQASTVLQRHAARAWDESDRVAMSLERLTQTLKQPRPARRKERVVLARTQQALERTEAVLAQTAQSLQRTAGKLAPLEAA